MKRHATGVLFLLLSTTAASASGGLSCTAEDPKVRFEVNAGVTRGMGSPVFSLGGEIWIEEKTLAADLAKTKLEREHLAQYWLDGSDLRLLLYRERQGDGFGYVELTVRSAPSGNDEEEGIYKGEYSLTVYDGEDGDEGRNLTYAGKVSCFVE